MQRWSFFYFRCSLFLLRHSRIIFFVKDQKNNLKFFQIALFLFVTCQRSSKEISGVLKRKRVVCFKCSERKLFSQNCRQFFSSFSFHHFTTKILQLTKIFLPFAAELLQAICSMWDCLSIGCLAFSWNYADCGKKNPISNKKGVHSWLFSRKKEISFEL